MRSARGLFGDEFCEESKEARVQEFEELWARVTAVINDNKIDENVKEALKTCFMLCGGGLVSSVASACPLLLMMSRLSCWTELLMISRLCCW